MVGLDPGHANLIGGVNQNFRESETTVQRTYKELASYFGFHNRHFREQKFIEEFEDKVAEARQKKEKN